MKIAKTKFAGLMVFQGNTHIDKRGYFRELFIKKTFKKEFIFDYVSMSKKNVIRGLHIQTK